ncbi:MAG: 6-carboxytetrahydropterin synthase [Armatimonadetes bacterium]|nr:6-carboxytetrahydropterin synthase [Armatimonadota bacterium]
MYELIVRRHFDAAHRLMGYGGKCENLHGHRYTAEVVLRAPRLNSIGLAVDFEHVKHILDEVLPDHQYINDLLPRGFNASAERIAEWLFEQVRERVRPLEVEVVRMTVWESPDCGASYFVTAEEGEGEQLKMVLDLSHAQDRLRRELEERDRGAPEDELRSRRVRASAGSRVSAQSGGCREVGERGRADAPCGNVERAEVSEGGAAESVSAVGSDASQKGSTSREAPSPSESVGRDS